MCQGKIDQGLQEKKQIWAAVAKGERGGRTRFTVQLSGTCVLRNAGHAPSLSSNRSRNARYGLWTNGQTVQDVSDDKEVPHISVVRQKPVLLGVR